MRAGTVGVVVAAFISMASMTAYADRSPIPIGFPDATNTGIAGAGLGQDDLTYHEGSITVTVDGTVIEDMYIRGGINVKADNVTIRNTYIDAGLYPDGVLYGINASFGGQNTLVEDVTIIGAKSKGLYGGNMTVRRVNVSLAPDSLYFSNAGNATVEDSFFHSQITYEGSHNDASQSAGGGNLTLRGNTLLGPYQEQTSAIIFQTNQTTTDNVLIEDNFLSGGTHTVYLRERNHGPLTNVVVRNNIWEKNGWKFSPLSSDAEATFSGNIYHTGEPYHDQPGDPRQAPTFPEAVTMPTFSAEAVGSELAWGNRAIGDQAEPFVIRFDAVAGADNMDAAVGLLHGEAGAWDDLAAILRFHPAGVLDVRNGAAYDADAEVAYLAGDLFHVRMVLDPLAHTYSVFITPEGGGEVPLAHDYAFRDGQAGLDSLDHVALRHVTGKLFVDNLAVIPEPAGVTLLGLGAVVLLRRQRVRR